MNGEAIFNRRHLDEQLQKECNTSRRHVQPMAILMLDIDHFKLVNDSEGHPAGDRVLQEFASRLTASVRSGSVVGRWGGEEFLVIAPQTNVAEAGMLGERIRAAIADRRVNLGDHDIAVTVSIGCAVGRGADRAGQAGRCGLVPVQGRGPQSGDRRGCVTGAAGRSPRSGGHTSTVSATVVARQPSVSGGLRRGVQLGDEIVGDGPTDPLLLRRARTGVVEDQVRGDDRRRWSA